MKKMSSHLLISRRLNKKYCAEEVSYIMSGYLRKIEGNIRELICLTEFFSHNNDESFYNEFLLRYKKLKNNISNFDNVIGWGNENVK